MIPAPPARLTLSATDWLLLVTLSILWGGSFFFAKIAVTELPPRAAVQISVVLPTDMPEAEIDYHLLPVGAPPAPAGEAR